MEELIDIPRGKTLGGSSSINGMVFNRGQNLDFDVWAQKGNKGWSYSDLLPYFKKYEKRYGEFDDVYRGVKVNCQLLILNTEIHYVKHL